MAEKVTKEITQTRDYEFMTHAKDEMRALKANIQRLGTYSPRAADWNVKIEKLIDIKCAEVNSMFSPARLTLKVKVFGLEDDIDNWNKECIKYATVSREDRKSDSQLVMERYKTKDVDNDKKA